DDLTAGQIKVPVTVPPEGQALEVEVSIKDPAGNTSSPVTETATVDTTAPATPAAPTSYVDNVGAEQGVNLSGSTTDDRTPGLNIGGGLTDTLTLYVDGVAVDAVYDPLTGTLTPTEPLSEGEHELSYTLTDAAGNESAQSPALTLTIDTTAPTLTITSSDLELGAGETSTITFQFSEDVAGFTASDVVVAGGTLSNFVQVDANTWTATFTQSGTAAPSISVANGTYSDAAGNAGIGDILDGTDGFIFNPTASDLIGAITIPEDVNGDGIINAEELDIDGVFEAQVALGADAVVGNVITVNGTTYTVTQADIDAGFITATIAVAADGEVAIRAEARDAAGNVDVADTTVQVITVDTTAPATPAAPTSYVDNVGAEQGVNLSGSTTDDRTPGLNIGGGLTDTPTLYVDGVAVDAVYDPLTGTLTPTEPLSEGEHELSYTLTDAAGNESAESPALTLTVDTSFIDASEIVSATEDTPLNVLATDPNGLLAGTSSVDGTVSIQSFMIAGDTTTYTAGQIATITGVGSLLINSDGSYTFTPVVNYNGFVPLVTYTSTDGNSTDISTLTLKVVGVNDAPVATPTTATTNEDTAVTLTPSVTDPDAGDVLTVTSAVSANGGTVTINADGTLNYTPALNYVGDDVVTYTVTDAAGQTTTSTITVTVTGVNDAPVATPTTATTNEDTAVTLTPSVTDPDAGDVLTVTSAVS
ncbi:cadherin-like domain-containing protein, partial [Acinetobacter junii]|uniref:cadherin-like domain-containing protein n=3 Tax=Acinetobacter TaxID=469 RepID=UPI00285D5161